MVKVIRLFIVVKMVKLVRRAKWRVDLYKYGKKRLRQSVPSSGRYKKVLRKSWESPEKVNLFFLTGRSGEIWHLTFWRKNAVYAMTYEVISFGFPLAVCPISYVLFSTLLTSLLFAVLSLCSESKCSCCRVFPCCRGVAGKWATEKSLRQIRMGNKTLCLFFIITSPFLWCLFSFLLITLHYLLLVKEENGSIIKHRDIYLHWKWRVMLIFNKNVLSNILYISMVFVSVNFVFLCTKIYKDLVFQ